MSTLKDWPYYPLANMQELNTFLRDLANIRKDDITQFSLLPAQYWLGRTVGKIPANSNDIASGDKIGDLSYDYNAGNAIYVYFNG